MNTLDQPQSQVQPNMMGPSEDLALKEVFGPIWVRRWKVTFVTLLVTLVMAFYVSLLKPQYRAVAVLQIGSNQPSNTMSLNDAFSESSASSEQIQTQYELLRSRKFAERVITRLNLVESEVFNSGKYNDKIDFLSDKKIRKAPRSVANIVGLFQANLTISPVSNTELVRISFSSYSPELSQQVANQVGETYLQYQDEMQSAVKESTSHWLVDQLEELGKKLELSEIALQQYREDKGIVDIQGIAGLVSSELKSLTLEALKAKKNQDDLKVSYEFIKKNRDNVKELIELPSVRENATYGGLRNSEEKVERKAFELAKRYGPKHPKMIAVQAELESLKNRIIEQVEDYVESIEKDYFNSIEKVNATQSRVASAKEDFLRLSRLKNKFSQLEREVDTNKEVYNSYLVRLKEADAMGDYKSNFYVRFIDKAITPNYPFAPNKRTYVVISFILSFAMISMIVIMKELLVDTLNSRRKLENFNDAPVLAVLPKFKMAIKNDSPQVDNRFTEAIRTLRTALLFNHQKAPPKVIAVTSSVPNEGKSTIALHLARSFAEMEKVLLIEGDMRHPTVANNLDLDPHRPGLSNLLAKTHQINECITRDKDVKLDILTSGITPANPLAFLSMKRFNMLIKVFGNFYDRIIIETPPVNAVSDAVIIAKNVDSVIYAVHATKTKREQISEGLRMLKQTNAPLQGIVVNQSVSIDTGKYHNKYYNDMANIVKLPVRKQS